MEAFFLVHAPKQNATKSADPHKDAESQLSHLEMQPLSPSMNLGERGVFMVYEFVFLNWKR